VGAGVSLVRPGKEFRSRNERRKVRHSRSAGPYDLGFGAVPHASRAGAILCRAFGPVNGTREEPSRIVPLPSESQARTYKFGSMVRL